MFKKKYILIDERWKLIDTYRSNIKPSIDELIYLNSKYYKIISIIHTIEGGKNKLITIVVKEDMK